MTKIAFISDIHSNFVALQAVLSVVDEARCDFIICGGDVVGYGAQPAECVREIREREIPCILGNHDEYVTLLMDPKLDRLREDIRKTVEWTQAQLPMDDLKWLAQLPLRIDAEDFSLVHGAFGPKPYLYCSTPDNLATNFDFQDVHLGFCGHSHVPMLAYNIPDVDGEPSVKYLRKTRLPEAEKLMINVGSVGQPRDKDPRAAFVLFELEDEVVELVRVPYDIEKAQELIRAAGLPDKNASRLAEGR